MSPCDQIVPNGLNVRPRGATRLKSRTAHGLRSEPSRWRTTHDRGGGYDAPTMERRSRGLAKWTSWVVLAGALLVVVVVILVAVMTSK